MIYGKLSTVRGTKLSVWYCPTKDKIWIYQGSKNTFGESVNPQNFYLGIDDENEWISSWYKPETNGLIYLGEFE